jgi:hypothetical protein
MFSAAFTPATYDMETALLQVNPSANNRVQNAYLKKRQMELDFIQQSLMNEQKPMCGHIQYQQHHISAASFVPKEPTIRYIYVFLVAPANDMSGRMDLLLIRTMGSKNFTSFSERTIGMRHYKTQALNSLTHKLMGTIYVDKSNFHNSTQIDINDGCDITRCYLICVRQASCRVFNSATTNFMLRFPINLNKQLWLLNGRPPPQCMTSDCGEVFPISHICSLALNSFFLNNNL